MTDQHYYQQKTFLLWVRQTIKESVFRIALMCYVSRTKISENLSKSCDATHSFKYMKGNVHGYTCCMGWQKPCFC